MPKVPVTRHSDITQVRLVKASGKTSIRGQVLSRVPISRSAAYGSMYKSPCPSGKPIRVKARPAP